MATSESSGLWQLYTLSAAFVLSSLFMYGLVIDPCLLVTGKSPCNPGAEAYTSRAMATGLLYVGTYFFALTYINRNSSPKLNRLANMGLNCVVALIVSIIFIGPTSQGGYESSILHVLDLIAGFILLAIMVSAVGDGTNMAPPKSPWEGLGLNSKTFILIIFILAFVKLFTLSELVNPAMFLSDPTSLTPFSHMMWRWVIVIILMILFPMAFTLVYGENEDQETLTGLTIVLMVVGLMSVISMSDYLKDGIMTMSYISLGIVTLLALTAIFVGRFNRRNEYEPV